MEDHEKKILTLAAIGAVIALGQVLNSKDPITPRLMVGRIILGSAVSMVAGVALVQFPDLHPVAINGIGCALGIAGYQFVERWLRRRGNKWVQGEDNDIK
ncbi:MULTISPECIES: phage holin family protein [Serratia]|uniref:phage holin family protein n=1 Tax=Serratia TaxID=613 RepID=UPI0019CFF20B|nr:phage holin family protein [Serratia ureilytica]MBN5280228.1 phage holin family protein [Serratia ureilytica]MBN5372042.1 phage holin family protein [Serratia ureilytica]HEI9850093.1 phage holin family protein [Serratia marcescens]